MTHAGFDETETSLHCENHKGTRHDPRGIVIFEFQTQLYIWISRTFWDSWFFRILDGKVPQTKILLSFPGCKTNEQLRSFLKQKLWKLAVVVVVRIRLVIWYSKLNRHIKHFRRIHPVQDVETVLCGSLFHCALEYFNPIWKVKFEICKSNFYLQLLNSEQSSEFVLLL